MVLQKLQSFNQKRKMIKFSQRMSKPQQKIKKIKQDKTDDKN